MTDLNWTTVAAYSSCLHSFPYTYTPCWWTLHMLLTWSISKQFITFQFSSVIIFDSFIGMSTNVVCCLRRRRLCFHFGLFVCPSDNWKSCERILTKFLGGVGHGPEINEFNFGDNPDHRPDPGVRSPKSAFTGLSKKLPTDFAEILRRAGVWLRGQLITFWWQSGSPFGSRSPKSGFTGLSIMLVFGGGLHSEHF